MYGAHHIGDIFGRVAAHELDVPAQALCRPRALANVVQPPACAHARAMAGLKLQGTRAWWRGPQVGEATCLQARRGTPWVLPPCHSPGQEFELGVRMCSPGMHA